MRTTRILVSSAIVGLTLSLAAPAVAADGDTAVSVTVTGGNLSMTVPASAGSLGSAANTVAGSTVSGQLGVVTVLDARNAAAGAGWVVSVISTAFTPDRGPRSVQPSGVHRGIHHQGGHGDLHGQQPA